LHKAAITALIHAPSLWAQKRQLIIFN
jgi:hypothetical protein